MALIDIDYNPKPKTLKNFGRISLIALSVLALLLHLLKGLPLTWVYTLSGFGICIFILSIISTKLIRPIYLAMTLLTVPIGYLVSFVILSIFYFIIITPIGLIFKITQRDILEKKFDPDAETYWIKRKNTTDPKRYFNQF